MILRLRNFFAKKLSEEKIEDKVELDTNNIYVRLKIAMDSVRSTPIRLSGSPASLGNIESFSETLGDLLKSLMEVNETLNENKHIENGLFYVKEIRTVKFDQFLFVQDGFYIDDVPNTLQKVLEQIDVYYEHMKNGYDALYGVREHNHRQLYSYTETLVQFLSSIFDHFGE